MKVSIQMEEITISGVFFLEKKEVAILIHFNGNPKPSLKLLSPGFLSLIIIWT